MEKRPDQNMFDKEKEIQEHIRVVRSPRTEGNAKEGMMQPAHKEKGTDAKTKKSRIPGM